MVLRLTDLRNDGKAVLWHVYYISKHTFQNRVLACNRVYRITNSRRNRHLHLSITPTDIMQFNLLFPAIHRSNSSANTWRFLANNRRIGSQMVKFNSFVVKLRGVLQSFPFFSSSSSSSLQAVFLVCWFLEHSGTSIVKNWSSKQQFC